MQKCFVDFDSFLFDLQMAAIVKVKNDYGVNLTYAQINDWNFISDNYPLSLNAYTEWKHYKKGVYFEGAIIFMEALFTIFGKENVYILTNSHPSLIEYKDKEIEEIFKTTNIIHAADKHFITGDNFLLDDNCDNILNHTSHNKGGVGVLFDYMGQYGWNKTPIECSSDRIVRKTSYQEILDYIRFLKKGKQIEKTN